MSKLDLKVHPNGNKTWHLDGELRRVQIMTSSAGLGYKARVLDKEFHCEDGPAMEFENGDLAWFKHGKLNRLDGPAVIHVNGYEAWYLNDIEMTEQEHAEQTKKVIIGRGMNRSIICVDDHHFGNFLEPESAESIATSELIARISNL